MSFWAQDADALSGNQAAPEPFSAMQTLAYLLPVLTLALQKAEAEFEELARKGKAHTAGEAAMCFALAQRWADASCRPAVKGMLLHFWTCE